MKDVLAVASVACLVLAFINLVIAGALRDHDYKIERWHIVVVTAYVVLLPIMYAADPELDSFGLYEKIFYGLFVLLAAHNIFVLIRRARNK